MNPDRQIYYSIHPGAFSNPRNCDLTNHCYTNIKYEIKQQFTGTVGKVQRFGALVALTEDLGLVPSTHVVGHRHLYLQFQGIPLQKSTKLRHRCGGQTYIRQNARLKKTL